MSPLFEFQCSNGHITERLCSQKIEAMECQCGEKAKRKPSQVNFTFGFRLSDAYLNVKGHPHELIRNV